MKWNKADVTPLVETGNEKEFWVAIEFKRGPASKTEVVVFLAQYQNRPYKEGDEESVEDVLVSADGEYIDSVGWVTCQAHCEFDNYYTPISFNDNYRLLGWANYEPPIFTGVKAEC